MKVRNLTDNPIILLLQSGDGEQQEIELPPREEKEIQLQMTITSIENLVILN